MLVELCCSVLGRVDEAGVSEHCRVGSWKDLLNSSFPICSAFFFLLPFLSFLLSLSLSFLVLILASSNISLLRVINCQPWRTAWQCRPFSWWLSKLSGWRLVEIQPCPPQPKHECWCPVQKARARSGRAEGQISPRNWAALGSSWPDPYFRGTSVTQLPFPPVKWNLFAEISVQN